MTTTPEREQTTAVRQQSTSDAALERLSQAREIEARRRDLEELGAELDKVREELARVYALRWTRVGNRVRRTMRRFRRVQALALRAAHDPRKAVRVLMSDLRRPGRVTRMRRHLAGPAAHNLAAALRRQGLHEQALATLDAALAKDPRATPALAERTTTLVQLGELSSALDNARTLAAIANSDVNTDTVASIAGRLRELDTTWLPDLGHPVPLPPTGSGRILHLLKESRPYYDRGYTMRSHYMLRSQRDAGLHPAVVTSLGFPRVDGFTDFKLVEELDGIEHHRLDVGPDYPYKKLPFDRFLSEYARQALRVAATVRPDVIHAGSGFRGFETAVVALAVGRHLQVPVVYDVRSFLEATWTPDIARSLHGEHYRLRVRREVACMQQADLVFTIADTMRDEIVRRGIDPDKVIVIPNAVDPDSFRPMPPDEVLKRDLELGERTMLGYISNIGRREGLDFLVEAVARLVQSGRRDIGCLIVGDGPELPAVRTLIKRLGVGEYVRAVGQVAHEQIGRYYSLIDVFVVPRRNDEAARLVTPLKPFEAMAMARPLLVADLPALAEVVGDDRGQRFTAEDPAALAAAATRLVDNPELRTALGRAGRSWVERERTWAHNGQRYREAYGGLLDKGARR